MKKSTLRTCLIILAVSLIISIGYVMLNRSTSREATADEIAAYQAYAIDWSAVDGWEAGMTEKEFLLTLSIFQEDQTIGNNVHQVYSSDALPAYLYRCHELAEITLMDDCLYITYYAEDGDMIVLSYADEGLNEMAVYEAESDTLFHSMDGVSKVWNKFRGGFQWGKS